MNEQPLDLQAIKERAGKATLGPWRLLNDNSSYPPFYVVNKEYDDNILLHFELCVRNKNDAQFIEHARQDVPALIAEVERLQQQIYDERKEHLQKVFEVIGEADKKLVEENERLREALKVIETRCYGEGHYIEIAKIARKALDGEK